MTAAASAEGEIGPSGGEKGDGGGERGVKALGAAAAAGAWRR